MKLLYGGYIYESNNEDEYSINKIKKNNNHRYVNVDGVNYQLSNNNTDFELDIDKIEETPENSFYDNQIKKYEDYIKNGGIIETFPVQVSKIAYTLEDMLAFLDDSYNGAYEDDIYSLIRECENEKIIPNGLSAYSWSKLLYENEEDEPFHMFARLNPKARNIKECFPADIKKEEKSLIPLLTKVFEFFDETKEYTLTDMNHRFEAVKNLGAKHVMVEPV